METRDLILLAMSAADGPPFTPVQVQKMFFLLDENISAYIGGRHFNFQPYHYGPFDKKVYLEIEALSGDHLIEIATLDGGRLKTYRLTAEGNKLGKESFKKLPGNVQQYIQDVVDFVRPLSFTELVSAIYQAYPHMKENSVFS